MNGIRLYFSISFDSEGKTMIILLGGTKKTQKSDIQKAKKLMMELLKEE
jgi:putative component of toxin-antitoxin plasmid stabilization module